MKNGRCFKRNEDICSIRKLHSDYVSIKKELAYARHRLKVICFKYVKYVGFEVFTAVVMKIIIFWDMTPCSLLRFNRRFGGTYRLHLQGRRNKFSNACCLLACWFLLKFFFRPWRWMKAICSSETSVETQRTTRRHIPEVDTLRKVCLAQNVYFCKNIFRNRYIIDLQMGPTGTN
jgi:hypothetical protein